MADGVVRAGRDGNRAGQAELTLDLPRPAWWSKDVPFDKTGQTQLGWAKEAAARYREAAAKAPGRSSAKSKAFGALKAEMGVTGVTGVTDSVTEAESVTPSVTDVAEAERSVTPSVTVSKGALRAKRWREKQRT